MLLFWKVDVDSDGDFDILVDVDGEYEYEEEVKYKKSTFEKSWKYKKYNFEKSLIKGEAIARWGRDTERVRWPLLQSYAQGTKCYKVMLKVQARVVLGLGGGWNKNILTVVLTTFKDQMRPKHDPGSNWGQSDRHWQRWQLV